MSPARNMWWPRITVRVASVLFLVTVSAAQTADRPVPKPAQNPAINKKIDPEKLAQVQGARVEVPDLMKMTCDEAKRHLASQKTPLQLQCNGESRSAPRISRQDPVPKTVVQPGSVVQAYFDLAQQQLEFPPQKINPAKLAEALLVEVPDVTKRTCTDAQQYLASNDIPLLVRCRTDSNSQQLISRQEPLSKTRVKRGSVINAYFDPVETRVQVPPLRGLTPDEARGVLAQHNLVIGLVSMVNETGDPGRIGPQKPSEGSWVTPGTRVSVGVNPDRLTITLGPANLKAGQRLEVEATLEPNRPGAVYEFFWNDPNDYSGNTRTTTARAGHQYKDPGTYSVYAVVTDPSSGVKVQSNLKAVEVVPAQPSSTIDVGQQLPPKVDVESTTPASVVDQSSKPSAHQQSATTTDQVLHKRPNAISPVLRVDPQKSNAGQVVTFRAELNQPLPGKQFTYWFGDGQAVRAGDSVIHKYERAGAYKATVTAYVDGRELASEPQIVSVLPQPVPRTYYALGVAFLTAAGATVRVWRRNRKIRKMRERLVIRPCEGASRIAVINRARTTPPAVVISVHTPDGVYEVAGEAKAGGR